ncbi:hypothetical protein pipiens_010681 [Culex pipiens pipiens]|uniref:Inorganic phosphate cotransporter n=1 Tax=Culex pipiens pipiens TaxID=38569 RepID=A0ABD1DCL2_CULPP
MAVTNGIGAITGIIVPYVVGIMTPNHSIEEWRLVFWIAFAVFHVTNLAQRDAGLRRGPALEYTPPDEQAPRRLG